MDDERQDQRLGLPRDDLDAEEELRLAVVLNGGVSLAIWMGGVVLEIQRLTARQGAYGRLLTALSSRARADIIAGTSAGGINGGALALGQVYPDSDVAALREVWAKEGALIDLLQEPWNGQPASLLKGDEKFLPALRRAFAELLSPASLPGAHAYSPEDRPIHLTLTTTLLVAEEVTVTDALGAQVSQPSHTGRFTFLRLPRMLGGADDFSPPVGNLSDRLALAARCTASFPVAFEPVHVRVEAPRTPGAAGSTAEPELPGDAPDMSAHASFKVSRWVVDGGVLMNTPLQPVLAAIQAAPAAVQVRRALLLVVPDPYRASAEEKSADSASERPSTVGTLGHIVQSVESQTVAEELLMIQEHNMRAQARRDSRTDLLRTITARSDDVAGDLAGLAETLFNHYRDIRIWRAASSIARETAAILEEPAERLAHAIRGALRATESGRQRLPWVPDTFEQGLQGALAAAAASPSASDRVGEWGWGLASLERLSVAVHDLLKRSMWVLSPTSAERRQIMELRAQHSRVTGQLTLLRQADSAYWRALAVQVKTPYPGQTVPPPVLLEALRGGLAEWRTGLWRNVDASATSGRAVVPRDVPSLGTIAASLLDIGSVAAATMPRDIPDPDGLLQVDRLQVLQRVFDPHDPSVPPVVRGDAPPDWERRMRAALGLEVCYLCLVETDDRTASEQVIDLVRISAGVEQPFAPKVPAADRVTGLKLGHFAAFLKQTWRMNDWTWGRLDAANRLVWLLLDPMRLRRRVLLGGTASAEQLALAAAAPGGGSPAARRVLRTILGAEPGAEWTKVLALLDGKVGLDQGRDILQPLADQLIRELAEQIAHEEDPFLVTAAWVDKQQGEDETSAGASWLTERYTQAAASPVRTTTALEEPR